MDQRLGLVRIEEVVFDFGLEWLGIGMMIAVFRLVYEYYY